MKLTAASQIWAFEETWTWQGGNGTQTYDCTKAFHLI